jgi:hypothetical protein
MGIVLLLRFFVERMGIQCLGLLGRGAKIGKRGLNMMKVKLNSTAPHAYLTRAVNGVIDVSNGNGNFLIKSGHATLIEKFVMSKNGAEHYCGNKRPARKVFCQLKKGHTGSHRAVIFWE